MNQMNSSRCQETQTAPVLDAEPRPKHYGVFAQRNPVP